MSCLLIEKLGDWILLRVQLYHGPVALSSNGRRNFLRPVLADRGHHAFRLLLAHARRTNGQAHNGDPFQVKVTEAFTALRKPLV